MQSLQHQVRNLYTTYLIHANAAWFLSLTTMAIRSVYSQSNDLLSVIEVSFPPFVSLVVFMSFVELLNGYNII